MKTPLHSIALAVLAIAASSCGPRASERMDQVIIPPVKSAVAPQATIVHEATDAVDEGHRRLTAEVVELRSASREAASSARRAKAEADRLAAQKTATETELTDLSKLFGEVEARNLFLELKVGELEDTTRNQDQSIKRLRAEVAALRVQAEAKDGEVENLRQALDAANTRLARAEQERLDLETRAQKAERSAASGKTYARIVWAVGLLIVLLGVVAVLTKFSIIGKPS